KEVVDPLFIKRTGYNVYGKISPKNTTKRIVLVSGHHDSAYEFPLHARLGSRFSTFILLTLGLGLLTIILSSLRLLLLLFIPSVLSVLDWFFILPIASAIPMLAVALRLRSNRVVLGANDNLSAVSVTLGVGEWLQENPLQHTEVWLVSFACEENMRGSKRFAEAHRDELKDAYLLNFDGVGAGDLYVLTAEPMYRTTLTKKLCEEVVAAAHEDGLEVSVGAPPFGGTDASNFIHAGLQATSVVGISKEGFLENWHTLDDTPEMIDEQTLVNAVRLAVAFLGRTDKSLGS
ncbi:MAG: M28 family metallopeptidase, partial [Candidatus Thorarchaeota archaeon]